jgi:hypothetical protein
MQGMTREDVQVHPVQGQTLAVERKIINDHIYIWLHFGDSPVTITNDSGCPLRKLFDSADGEWLGPGANMSDELIELQPYSAVIYEKIV